jgi:DNA-binding MarR family transcriptional regulator
MRNKEFDIKFLLLDKLNFIEEVSLKEAHCYEFDENDIITATRILTFIQNGSYTSSSLVKKLNISRQAIHKSIANLCEKGFLELQKDEKNKKNKIIHITDAGYEILECRIKVMEKVEKKIAEKLGEENYKQLKKLLSTEW